MRTQMEYLRQIQIIVLILAGLILQPAHAEVIPGRWEKVCDLKLGTPVRVELKNGDQVVGDFAGLSVSEVEFKTNTARAVIPKADIQSIITQRRDGLGDGAAIGAGIGFGLGLGTMGIAVLRGVNVVDDPGATVAVLVVGGLGAAMGAAFDSGTKTDAIVVYKAPETP